MDASENDRIYQTALQQARDEAEPTRRERADQLIREALDAFVDPDAQIDLRDWVKTAREYLGDNDQGERSHRPRSLTRAEQLEALADNGCDTWEEYRGER